MKTIETTVEIIVNRSVESFESETFTPVDRDSASKIYFSAPQAISLDSSLEPETASTQVSSCLNCIHYHGGEAYGPVSDGIKRTCGYHPYGWDRLEPCPNHWGGGYGARNRPLE